MTTTPPEPAPETPAAAAENPAAVETPAASAAETPVDPALQDAVRSIREVGESADSKSAADD